MLSKIILGLLMGFFAGGSAKALTTASANPALAPVKRSWFDISARVAPIIAVIWVIYTFGAYSLLYGIMALAEVVIGAVIAGFLGHQQRLVIANVALPGMIVAWVVL